MTRKTQTFLIAVLFAVPSVPARSDDLTLQDAITLALGRNRALAAAEARTAEQEAALRAARAERRPAIDFSQRVTRLDDKTVARANSAADGLSQLIGFEIPPFVFQDSYRTQLDLSLPLWTAGALGASIAAEREALTARQADYEAAERATAAEVARRFFRLAAVNEVGVARQEALERAERRLEEAEHRLDVGLVTRQEVLRWQVQVEEARADLAAVEADRLLARLDLADVLNLSFDEVGEPRLAGDEDATALFAWADALDPADVLGRAEEELDDLPEVRAARAEEAAAGEAVRGVRAGRLPRLDASASYGWLENETLAPDEFQNWSATLLLRVPIDLRGRVKADIERQAARERQAATAVGDVRASLRLAVGSALADLIRARSRRLSASRAEQEAKARRELLGRQADVGLTGLLDLIDADATLAAAEVAYRSARVDLLAAVAALELAWPGANPPGGGLIP